MAMTFLFSSSDWQQMSWFYWQQSCYYIFIHMPSAAHRKYIGICFSGYCWWVSTAQVTISITWTGVHQDNWHIIALLGHSELILGRPNKSWQMQSEDTLKKKCGLYTVDTILDWSKTFICNKNEDCLFEYFNCQLYHLTPMLTMSDCESTFLCSISWPAPWGCGLIHSTGFRQGSRIRWVSLQHWCGARNVISFELNRARRNNHFRTFSLKEWTVPNGGVSVCTWYGLFRRECTMGAYLGEYYILCGAIITELIFFQILTIVTS